MTQQCVGIHAPKLTCVSVCEATWQQAMALGHAFWPNVCSGLVTWWQAMAPGQKVDNASHRPLESCWRVGLFHALLALHLLRLVLLCPFCLMTTQVAPASSGVDDASWCSVSTTLPFSQHDLGTIDTTMDSEPAACTISTTDSTKTCGQPRILANLLHLADLRDELPAAQPLEEEIHVDLRLGAMCKWVRITVLIHQNWTWEEIRMGCRELAMAQAP